MAHRATRQHPPQSSLRPRLQGMLVVCRAVFLMAALGFGTAALPDSLHVNTPESYPAAQLVALDTTSTEYKSVDARFDELDVVKPTLAPKQGPIIDGVIEPVPLKPRRWWKVETHPLLVKALPGIELFAVVGAQGRRIGPDGSASDWLMASSHGRLYYLPKDLNQLLYDNGMSFTGADIQTWTRVACVVWASVNRQELWVYDWNAAGAKPTEKRDYWDLPAIPAVTFQDVQVDTGPGGSTSVLLMCDGRSFRLYVGAWRHWMGTGSGRCAGIVPWRVRPKAGGPRMDLLPPRTLSRLDGGPESDQRDH